MSEKEAAKLIGEKQSFQPLESPGVSKSKHRNIPTTIDGMRFPSKLEANRYCELKVLERSGVIKELIMQKTYRLDVNGVHVTSYRADFCYVLKGEQIVEDTKGRATREFKIKSKLMKAIYGIDILIVSKTR